MLSDLFNVVSCPECWSPFKGKAEIAAHFQEMDPGVTDMVSECICVDQDTTISFFLICWSLLSFNNISYIFH